jgi:hypothetical protein
VRTASARCLAPPINSQSVKGIDGASVLTGRATILALRQAASISATRATLARTAMIFAARSEPNAIRSIVAVVTEFAIDRLVDIQPCALL